MGESVAIAADSSSSEDVAAVLETVITLVDYSRLNTPFVRSVITSSFTLGFSGGRDVDFLHTFETTNPAINNGEASPPAPVLPDGAGNKDQPFLCWFERLASDPGGSWKVRNVGSRNHGLLRSATVNGVLLLTRRSVRETRDIDANNKLQPHNDDNADPLLDLVDFSFVIQAGDILRLSRPSTVDLQAFSLSLSLRKSDQYLETGGEIVGHPNLLHLPNELLHKIIPHLPMKEAIRALPHVCQGMFQLVQEASGSCRHLRFLDTSSSTDGNSDSTTSTADGEGGFSAASCWTTGEILTVCRAARTTCVSLTFELHSGGWYCEEYRREDLWNGAFLKGGRWLALRSLSIRNEISESCLSSLAQGVAAGNFPALEELLLLPTPFLRHEDLSIIGGTDWRSVTTLTMNPGMVHLRDVKKDQRDFFTSFPAVKKLHFDHREYCLWESAFCSSVLMDGLHCGSLSRLQELKLRVSHEWKLDLVRFFRHPTLERLALSFDDYSFEEEDHSRVKLDSSWLFACFPNLKSLCLGDTRVRTAFDWSAAPAESLMKLAELSAPCLSALPIPFERMRNLELLQVHFDDERCDDVLTKITALPKLQALKITGDSVPSRFLDTRLSCEPMGICTSLRVVEISCGLFLSETTCAELDELLGIAPNVEMICLLVSSCSGARDVARVMNHRTNVKAVTLIADANFDVGASCACGVSFAELLKVANETLISSNWRSILSSEKGVFWRNGCQRPSEAMSPFSDSFFKPMEAHFSTSSLQTNSWEKPRYPSGWL